MKSDLKKAAAYILFFLYALIMLWLLFGQRISGSVGADFSYAEHFHLRPFDTIVYYGGMMMEYPPPSPAFWLGATQIFGNIAMFIPLGFFLPLCFEKLRRFRVCFPVIVLIDLGIELLQLVLRLGYCETDDLILNIPGACIGFLCFLLLNK